MRQRNIYGSRKGGTTMSGKFHANPTYSMLLAAELERKSNKKQAQVARAARRKEERGAK